MAIVWSRSAWAVATAYTLGARVTNASVTVDGFAFPCVYQCMVAGTSAASPATGPDGTTPDTPITDNTVTWRFLGPYGGEVLALAPQLSTIPAIEQALLLDIADTFVGEDYFADQSDAARLYMTAHLATMANLKGKGAVTAETVGALSRSYSTAPGLIGDLALTSYGAVFRRLQLATGAGLGFTA